MPRLALLLLISAAYLALLGCGGTSRQDDAATSFMSDGSTSTQGEQLSSAGFRQAVQISPAQIEIILASGERHGETTITLKNRSDQPWRIAQLESHCRFCRIIDVSGQQADPGKTVDITIRVHAARLERLPTRRFIQVVVVQPDNSSHEGWIPITVDR